MSRKRIVALSWIALLVSGFAHAARWSNSFIEFELPAQWGCTLEASEWICQSNIEAKKRDAIVVIAAKLKGDQDDLGKYLEHLKTSRTYKAQGRQVKSEPRFAKNVVINGQPWIDALHFEGEIPGFYSRYLATVKSDMGVLVSYSVARSKFSDYASEFDTIIKTLRVFRKPGTGINAANSGSLFGAVPIPTENPILTNPIIGGSDPARKPKQAQRESIAPILIGAAALVFFLLRRRRKRR